MRKVTSIFVVFVLILSLMACSSSTPNVSESGKNDKTDTTKQDDKKNKEKVKLTLVMKDEGPSNPVAVKFFDLLEQGLAEEGINVDIELVVD